MKRTPLKRTKWGSSRIHKKIKEKSVGWWKKKAWAVFSKWIRNRDNWTCFTCGTVAIGSGMHAGHFVPRSHSATFIHEMNVNAQCYVCNIIKKGNAGEYSFRLIEKYGKDKFDELVKLGRTYKSFTVQELKDLMEKYKL